MKGVLRNGCTICTNGEMEQKQDIFIDGNMICSNRPDTVDYELDMEGSYIFPGLIDYHAHIFCTGSETAIHPDVLLATGVTTVCDAGTSGPANAAAFMESIGVSSQIRVKFQVCLSPAGQAGCGSIEDYNPILMEKNKHLLQEIKERYPHQMTGLKIKFGSELVGEYGISSLDKALEVAEEVGLPLIVHVSNMPVSADKIAERLRPGDVFCHMYQGRGPYSILDTHGNVLKEVIKAKERGVIFDACNGMGNFSFAVAKKAIEQGFYPDIISTDHTTLTFAQKGYVQSISHLMSKYLEMGIPLSHILQMVTTKPAGLLNMEGRIGTLQPGAYADIAVCKLEEKECEFIDYHGEKLQGHRLLIPQLVIAGGRTVYRNPEF